MLAGTEGEADAGGSFEMSRARIKFPLQPLHRDGCGVIRFKENKIVRYLLDAGPFDMNQLALMSFPREDREQFAQLIGYSVSGFGDLSYSSRATVKLADKTASCMPKQKQRKARKA